MARLLYDRVRLLASADGVSCERIENLIEHYRHRTPGEWRQMDSLTDQELMSEIQASLLLIEVEGQ